jgi:hypothetical protein
MSILDSLDDFELCDRVFGALAENPINVDTCGELERVVRLVWDSSGLIGNGGLHRLFEGDYPGDPGFVYTVAAYHRIGARAAYEALQSAFSQFPGGVLPVEIYERLRVFESMPKRTRDEIERRYYDADKETERCLARFIRERRSGYERLLTLRRAEPGAAPNGGPATPVGNSGVTEGPPSVS